MDNKRDMILESMIKEFETMSEQAEERLKSYDPVRINVRIGFTSGQFGKPMFRSLADFWIHWCRKTL